MAGVVAAVDTGTDVSRVLQGTAWIPLQGYGSFPLSDRTDKREIPLSSPRLILSWWESSKPLRMIVTLDTVMQCGYSGAILAPSCL